MYGNRSSSEIKNIFLNFAENECVRRSPLYENLSYRVAQDPYLLELAGQVPDDQPPPNLLFASVHHLLLQGAEHPLASHFLIGDGDPQGDPGDQLRHFCLSYTPEILNLLHTRRVQTNEPRRSAVLLPALLLAGQALGTEGLSIIEIGSSAGLNLIWDQYKYRYSSGQTWGKESASLQLETEIRGKSHPSLPEIPPVKQRQGVDIHPLHPRRIEDRQWLEALVWPEQEERRQRLKTALDLAQGRVPPLVEGNALEHLPQLIDQVQPNLGLIVFHSFTLYQFSTEDREELEEIWMWKSADREIHVVGLEFLVKENAVLHWSTWRDGDLVQEKTLAHADGHGFYLEWLG